MIREPVAIANTIAALIEGGIVLGIAFGLEMTPEQIAAISGFVILVGQTAATLYGRSKVTPVADPRI